MNKPTFKTINFRGKEYVEVKERIGFLRYEFEGDYELTTDYQYYEDRQMWIAKATLTLHMDGKSFTYTGHAQELESSSNINKTSALENAETSAIGRACAAAGIGIDTAFASANEMEKAINREKANTKPAPKDELSALKHQLWHSTADMREIYTTEKVKAMTLAEVKKALEVVKQPA
jgi:hypothetical protein